MGMPRYGAEVALALRGLLSSTYIIKVGDDLVQEPQALQALLVDV